MKYLHSIIEINKEIENKKKTVEFYILKGTGFGIQIDKKENEKQYNIINEENIFEKKEDAIQFLNNIIANINDESQIKYLLEDYKNEKKVYI